MIITFECSNDGSDADITELEQTIQSGDIIFQTSRSSQSKAIQMATYSKYSHLGIIYENDGQFLVYETVQPVKLTPISDWINRGENGHYVIKRLKNADLVLTESVLTKMKQAGEQFKGKPYDIYFEWSDVSIYCSELVWKIYNQAANIEIGQPEQLSDFDLTDDPDTDIDSLLVDYVITAAEHPDELPTGVLTSLTSIDKNELRFGLYPNPAKNEVIVSLSGNVPASYRIYNILGAEVKRGLLNSGETVIDISRLKDGIYLVNVQAGNIVGTQKLVVR